MFEAARNHLLVEINRKQFQSLVDGFESRHRDPISTMSFLKLCLLPIRNGVFLQPQRWKAWGFEYKTNLVWHKIRKDGGPDGRGVGFSKWNENLIVVY